MSIAKQVIASNFIQKHPNKTFDDFVRMTGNKHKINSKDYANGRRKIKEIKGFNEAIRKVDKKVTLKKLEYGTASTIIRQFLRENPDAVFSDYDESDNPPTTSSRFYVLKRQLAGKGVGTRAVAKFKKSIVSVIGQLDIPDSFGDKSEVLRWLDENLLNKLNAAQSVFKVEIVGNFYPEPKIELRLHTTRNSGRM